MDSITTRHVIERFGALDRMLSRWVASAHRNSVTQWLDSPSGKRYDSHGGYVIAGRGIGFARLSFDDGKPDRVIFAPCPLA